MARPFLLLLSLLVSVAVAGCQSAQQHAQDVDAANADANRLTVGTVQREIRVGMSGADVASVLGSPNIVTTDEQRREVWLYDRIATSRAYSTSSGGISALILGGVIGGGGPSWLSGVAPRRAENVCAMTTVENAAMSVAAARSRRFCTMAPLLMRA